MSIELNPFQIRNLGLYGVIRNAEITDFLFPEGALSDVKNVHFDRKGAVTQRSGYTNIGSQISDNYSCLGLYNALYSDSTKNCLLSVFSDGTNNDVYKSTGGAWTKSLQDDTKALKTRFATFADRAIRVNGTDAVKVFDGSAWATTGNPINPDDAPLGKFIEVFKNKVYITGVSANPDRLYESSTVDSSGNITWDISATGDWTDINPNDGENTTGLKRFSLELLVFKPNYIYRFRTSDTDPDPLIKIGTSSNESIVEGKKGLYFHHDTGFYIYTGGYPEEISKAISDVISAIPLTYYDDISAWRDDDHIYWSIGDITLDGETRNNVVCRYTESSKLWTIYQYATEFRWACDFRDSAALKRVAGDDDGNVSQVLTGTSDNGTTISYYFITHWYELGILFRKKLIQKLYTLALKMQGAKLTYRVDNDNHPWKSIGQIKEELNVFDKLDIQCTRIKFKITGMSKQEAFVFLGIIISNLSDEGDFELKK